MLCQIYLMERWVILFYLCDHSIVVCEEFHSSMFLAGSLCVTNVQPMGSCGLMVKAIGFRPGSCRFESHASIFGGLFFIHHAVSNEKMTFTIELLLDILTS